MRSVTVFGVGRLGGALAIPLSNAGYYIRRLVSRNGDLGPVVSRITPRPEVVRFAEITALDSEIIFITTADAEIEPALNAISDRLDRSSAVFHASGALSSQVLGSAKKRGNPVGSIHPLLSVSDAVTGSGSFAGAHFCIEGDTDAVTLAREMVTALGGHPFSIDPGLKPLYHASAVLASGHMVALFSLASEVLSACGPTHEDASEILLPLVQSTIRNLLDQGPAQALTGPFARADLDTIKLHLEAFRSAPETNAEQIYLELGLKSSDLAAEAGVQRLLVDRVREYIKLAKGHSR